MRGVLAILAIAAAGTAILAWSINLLYLAPRADAEARQVALVQQLEALRQREADAGQSSTATTSPVEVGLLAATDDDPAGYAARFQDATRKAVLEFGGQPASAQTISAAMSGGLTKVSLLLRARFDEPGLLGFLRATEQTLPIVLVDTLQVRPLPMTDDVHPLDVTANLTVFRAGS